MAAGSWVVHKITPYLAGSYHARKSTKPNLIENEPPKSPDLSYKRSLAVVGQENLREIRIRLGTKRRESL
jgi:hypothetical protein